MSSNGDPRFEIELTQYLLGGLSERKAEQFDQLSITDDEFASRLSVVENNLVDAYVHDELSGETLQRFQSYYLSTPKRREKVKVARILACYKERE